MTILIRQARQSDRAAINSFIDQAYGPIAPYKGSARWIWQFVSNPFSVKLGDLVPVWLAQDEGRIVGQIAIQPAIVRVDSKEFPAGWMVDVMVLAQYRGRSLGHRLHEAVAHSIPFLVMLTMAPATRRMALRANCVTLGPVRQFVKLVSLDGDTLRRYLVGRTSHRPFVHRLVEVACDVMSAHHLLSTIAGMWVRRRDKGEPLQRSSNISIEEIEVFSDEIERFWECARAYYPAIFPRSKEFLNWRFFGAPDLRYLCFVARRSEKCVGYVVLRRTLAIELRVGVIVDWLTFPHETEVLRALIDHALFTFGDEVAAVECVSCRPEIDSMLRHLGFFPIRTTLPTVVCRDAALRQRVHELRNQWYFTKCDHDWDQILPAQQKKDTQSQGG